MKKFSPWILVSLLIAFAAHAGSPGSAFRKPSGKIVLTTEAGARVWIDNRNAGTATKTAFTVNVPVGKHTLKISKPNHYDYTNSNISVTVGRTTNLGVIRLRVIPGSIKIASNPPGASVLLDGQSKGTTPLTIPNIAPGTHSIRVAKQGYNRYQQRVAVASGQTLNLNIISLVPLEMAPVAIENSTPIVSGVVDTDTNTATTINEFAEECRGTVLGQEAAFDLSYDPFPVPVTNRLDVVVTTTMGNWIPSYASLVNEEETIWAQAIVGEGGVMRFQNPYNVLNPNHTYSIVFSDERSHPVLKCSGFRPDPRANRPDYEHDYWLTVSSNAGARGDSFSITVYQLFLGAADPRQIIIRKDNAPIQRIDLREATASDGAPFYGAFPKTYIGDWSTANIAAGQEQVQYQVGLATGRREFQNLSEIWIYDSPFSVDVFPNSGLVGTRFVISIIPRFQRTPTGILFRNGGSISRAPVYDDGRHDDGLANDNLFSAVWTPDRPGQYQIGILERNRETMTSLNVSVLDASLFTESCIPIFPEINNPDEERFNVVFVGLNFEKTDAMRAKLFSFLQDYLDTKKQHEGLLTVEPYRSVPKFNYWFVPNLGPLFKMTRPWKTSRSRDEGVFYDGTLLSLSCPFDFDKKITVALIKDYPHSSWALSTGFAAIRLSSEGLDENAGAPMKRIGYKLIHHELGHAIWGLNDLYVSTENLASESPDLADCHGPSSREECMQNASWKELMGDDCGRPGVIDCDYDPERGCADESCHEVGCFEGACHVPNLWRPQLNNLMRHHGGLPGEKSTYGVGLTQICKTLHNHFNRHIGVCAPDINMRLPYINTRFNFRRELP
ncbi:MAG: PEGA domain-containing protein [Deltaproteobacteria bacterium]|nr:PEGA domain-containing protein [Deltaproteobacteria bacterium]